MHGINSINGAYVSDQASATNNTLNATPTGSSDTAILRFNVAATAVGTVTEATTAAGGTIVTIAEAGVYHVSFALVFAGAVALAAGFSFGASQAVAITADPVVGVANVIYSVDALGVATTGNAITGATVVFVEQADIAAGLADIMFHATNSAGAAPVGITAASAQYRIVKIANLSS